jgi:hypothetical protein
MIEGFIENLIPTSGADLKKEDVSVIIDNELSDTENDKPPSSVLGIKKKKLLRQTESAIDYYTYEFDKLLVGKRADQLTKYLAFLPHSSPLFENKTIQAYINSQW